MSDPNARKRYREPTLTESPHGWKDARIWKFIPRRPFIIISSVCIAAYGIREFKILGRTPAWTIINKSMSDKTVIVTGATSGIGKASAEKIATRGARLIMACRDMKKCSEIRRKIIHKTGNHNIACRYLELRSLKSVRKFADKIRSETDRIDVLVNNAGVMLNPKLSAKYVRQVTEEGFEMHMGVNHFGPFLLTNLLADRLVASAPSHIINISCNSYKHGALSFENMNLEEDYHARRAYYTSKQASVMFSRELARRLLHTNVKVITLGLPRVNSEIQRNYPYYKWRVLRWFIKSVRFVVMTSPGEVSYNVLASIFEFYDGEHGLYTTVNGGEQMDPSVINDLDAQKLWKLSEKWVGIDYDTIPQPVHPPQRERNPIVRAQMKKDQPNQKKDNPNQKVASVVENVAIVA